MITTTVKETPILFNAEMVSAIIYGRKTQTRRIIKLKNKSLPKDEDISTLEDGVPYLVIDSSKTFPYWEECKPIYDIGDVLWVRETFRFCQPYGPDSLHWQYRDNCIGKPVPIEYAYVCDYDKWRPSIHMPKAACRIWLEVINIRVERLQDISEEDAIAEGIIEYETGCFHWAPFDAGAEFYPTAKEAFKALWISIYGIESWEANPWVWIVEFKILSTTGREAAYKKLEAAS